MSIDILTEITYSLAEITKLDILPHRRQGKRPNVSTLYRWAKQGIKGIRLETIRVGGTLCTSTQAVQRFIEASTETDEACCKAMPNPEPKSLPAYRRAAIEAAEKKLAAMGIRI